MRKERLEQERAKEKDTKKVQLKQAAAAQQAAIAASNMYANQYYTSGTSSSSAAQRTDSGPLAVGSGGIAVPGFAQHPMHGFHQQTPYTNGLAPTDVGLPIYTPSQDATISVTAQSPPMPTGQMGHFPGYAMVAGAPAYGSSYALPPQASAAPGGMNPQMYAMPQYPPPHPSSMYATQPTSAVYPPHPMQSLPQSGSTQLQGAYPPRPPQQMVPPMSKPAPVPVPTTAPTVKAEESEGPSTTKAQGSAAAEVEEDVPEVDDRQLAYSTMEGVRMVPQPDILKAELHEHQVRILFILLIHTNDYYYCYYNRIIVTKIVI